MTGSERKAIANLLMDCERLLNTSESLAELGTTLISGPVTADDIEQIQASMRDVLGDVRQRAADFRTTISITRATLGLPRNA